MKILRPLLTALLIGSVALPAQAWGQRERDVLTGVVTATVIGSMVRQNREHRAASASRRLAQYPVAFRASGDSEARAAFTSFTGRTRLAIQDNLARHGYYAGQIDGTWGPATWTALRAYAADRGARQALESYAGTMSVFEDLML